MNKPQRHKQNQQQPQQVIHQQRTTVYRGQLPPPEMLEKFENIQPGFTDRLLTLVEEESRFKRKHDADIYKSFKASTVLGIIFAFLSVLVVAGVAVYSIYKGFDTAAATIMSTCVVGVIIAFIQRRKATREEKK